MTAGRNRREAAKLAGIVPPVIVTDVDPKLAVHWSNNSTRTATDSQKAMAFAMAFPESKRGKHSHLKNLSGTIQVYVSNARYVYRNHPVANGKDHPQICYDVINGLVTLSEAFKSTQIDVANREAEEAIRQANADKLNELAEDIKDNGFDHRYPITIAEVSGEWMLLDGRNRREAAKLAGIVPPVIVTDVDPKLAVHRSNNQNRDATPGQKAMATAMAFPEAANKGGRGKINLHLEGEDFSKNHLSRARYVLRNNPIPDGEHYPQRCLAALVDDQRLGLPEAIAAGDQRRESERLEAERIAREGAEKERQRFEKERLERESAEIR